MRRLFPLAVLALAGCATRPTPPPAPPPAAPAPVVVRTELTGMTEAELRQKFGLPSFQLREGPGLMLQWQNASCVLDAYLYPGAATGAATVTHVDARRPMSGDSLPLAACVTALTAR